jgi:hypothetical protein
VTADDLRAAQLGRTFEAWKAELALLGGTSALVDIAALGNTVIDLTKAHPGGLSHLLGGRPTPLSSLIRDKAAAGAAATKAEAVRALAADHASRYGLPPTHLGVGIATWTEVDPEDEGHLQHRRVPVMLRPIEVNPTAHGIELKLEPSVMVNPVLVRFLNQHGIPADATSLAHDAFAGGSFNQVPVLDAVRAMGAAVCPDFAVRNKLIVGVYEHPGQLLADDLTASTDLLLRHPLVSALAGDAVARAALGSTNLPPKVFEDRPPDHERGVGDLGPDQLHVLDVVATGASVLVDAPPGAPTGPTVAGLIADAVGSGRSVLYVSGQRSDLKSVVRTLRGFGLGECLQELEPATDWQAKAVTRLIEGLTYSVPPVDVAGIGHIRGALAERAGQIASYLQALHTPLTQWNVSAFEALQEIARIAEESPDTRTGVHLDRKAAARLVGEVRDEVKGWVRRATELGMFQLTQEDTAWYGAFVTDQETADDLLRRLDRLRSGALAAAIEQMREITGQAGLEESATMADWGEQLQMLAGVRDALDRFLPEIFETSPEELVAATATPEWRAEHDIDMPARVRRRLRKQARDLVRPGLQVDDLHASLVKIHEQREIWLSWQPKAPWPKLPVGMARVEGAYAAVKSDLDALDAALATGSSSTLGGMNFDELLALLDRLHADRASLDFLPEMNSIAVSLHQMGLGGLLADLTERRVGPAAGTDQAAADAALEAAAREVDFCWWSSVLAFALEEFPVLSMYGGDALAGLVESYRELDIAHSATKPGPIRAAVAGWRDQAVEHYPGQGFKLTHMDGTGTLRDAFLVAADISLRSRPCIVAGPVMVPQAIPLAELGTPLVDLVIIDSADRLTPAQTASSLARGRQAVVIGDATRGETDTLASVASEFLPIVSLPAEVNERDPRLTNLLVSQGYTTLGPALPLPDHQRRLVWAYVDGLGSLSPKGDKVLPPAADIEQVAVQVTNHLAAYPDETVGVIAGTPDHAKRILVELDRQAHTGNLAVAGAFAGQRQGRLTVTHAEAAAGLSFDTVVFAPGLTRSPRGLVLYDFGVFSSPEGATRLTDVLVAARRRLAVVSCLKAEDLDLARLKDPGSKLMRRLLSLMEKPPSLPTDYAGLTDPLFADLARRVERRGARVTTNYGPPGGPYLTMSVRPAGQGSRESLAVLTDDADFIAEPSLRTKVRLWPAHLEKAGWQTMFAWSAPVFMDPEAEARSIAQVTFAGSHAA